MGIEHDLYDLRNVRTFYLGKSYALAEAIRELQQEKEILELLSLEMTGEEALARKTLVEEFLHACLEESESGPWYDQQIERLAIYLAEARGKVGLGSDSDGTDFDLVALSAGFVRLLSAYEETERDQFCVREFASVEALRADAEQHRKKSHDAYLFEAKIETPLPGAEPFTSWRGRLGNLARIAGSEEFWFLCEKQDVLLYTSEKTLRPDWPWHSIARCDGRHVPLPTDEMIVERQGTFSKLHERTYGGEMVWRKHPCPFSEVVTEICKPYQKV